jgi:ABC-2 type transport system permease protein
MFSRAVTWWTVVRISLEERLVYRGDFALGTLMRFLPIVTQIFLWYAIFTAQGGTDQTLFGYRYQEMVAYFLLTMVARAFSSMPGLASSIARQIREGEIKRYLIQPIDLLNFLAATRVAHKLAYYSIAIGPFALVFWLCRDFFTTGFPPWPTFFAFLLSLVLGFMLGFYLEASLGLIGFWFLEISSLLFVYMLFSFFLSGHMFPLTMLPEPWQSLVLYSPLQYLAFFPAAVFLQKIEGPELVRGLLLEVFWVAFFIVLSRFLYNRGVKRYSGFGG